MNFNESDLPLRPELYGGDPETVLEAVRGDSESVGRLLLIRHNPT